MESDLRSFLPKKQHQVMPFKASLCIFKTILNYLIKFNIKETLTKESWMTKKNCCLYHRILHISLFKQDLTTNLSTMMKQKNRTKTMLRQLIKIQGKCFNKLLVQKRPPKNNSFIYEVEWSCLKKLLCYNLIAMPRSKKAIH